MKKWHIKQEQKLVPAFLFFSIRCRSYLTKSAVEKRKKYQNIKPNFYKKVDKVIILCYNKFEVKGNDKPLAKK